MAKIGRQADATNAPPSKLRDTRKTQKTQPKKGEPVEIPVPTRGEFDDFVKKVAPPAGRKRPGGKAQPPERSER